MNTIEKYLTGVLFAFFLLVVYLGVLTNVMAAKLDRLESGLISLAKESGYDMIWKDREEIVVPPKVIPEGWRVYRRHAYKYCFNDGGFGCTQTDSENNVNSQRLRGQRLLTIE